MTAQHPFRFGVGLDASSSTPLTEQISKAEAYGYSSVVVGDHLNVFGTMQTAPISSLAVAAVLSKSINIACHMFCNDFWHPTVLVRELATIDILCGGRLEVGIGAGWWQQDYDASGIPFDPPGLRISRMEEAVQILKAFFTGEPVTFSGKYYHINNLKIPDFKPRSHPRLTMGGGGKRVLSLAAQEADIISLNARGSASGTLDVSTTTADAVTQKIEWVRQAAGERFSQLELHILQMSLVVTENPEEEAEKIVQFWKQWMYSPVELTSHDVLASPHVLIGTIDEMVETLEKRREQYGLSYITVFGGAMEAFAPVVARLSGK